MYKIFGHIGIICALDTLIEIRCTVPHFPVVSSVEASFSAVLPLWLAQIIITTHRILSLRAETC